MAENRTHTHTSLLDCLNRQHNSPTIPVRRLIAFKNKKMSLSVYLKNSGSVSFVVIRFPGDVCKAYSTETANDAIRAFVEKGVVLSGDASYEGFYDVKTLKEIEFGDYDFDGINLGKSYEEDLYCPSCKRTYITDKAKKCCVSCKDAKGKPLVVRRQKYAAIDRIKNRSGQNEKSETKYQVHGSTFTLAHFYPDDHEKFARMYKQNRRYRFFIYGNFLSWSHLPTYSFRAEFQGYVEHDCVLGEKLGSAFFADAWLKENVLSMMSDDDIGVVFFLKYVHHVDRSLTYMDRVPYKDENGVCKTRPEAVTVRSWCGHFQRRRNEEDDPIPTGNLLRGFFSTEWVCNEFAVRKCCKNLASFGHDKQMWELTDAFLEKELLGLSRPLMKHRLKDALRFEKKSDLFCEVVCFFPAPFGQYLLDDRKILNDVKHFIETCQENMDFFFYGPMDYVFERKPYQNQVKLVLELWEDRFPNRMNGWRKRFDAWEKIINLRSIRGSPVMSTREKEEFAISKEAMQDFFDSNVFTEIETYYVKQVEHKKFCFSSDYKLMDKFVDLFASLQPTNIYVGRLPVSNGLLLHVSDAVKQHQLLDIDNCEWFSLDDFSKQVRYAETVSLNRKMIPLLGSKRKEREIVLYGLDFWPFDLLVFLLVILHRKKWKFSFHFFGFENFPKVALSNRRLLPLLTELRQTDVFHPHTFVDLPMDDELSEREIDNAKEAIDFLKSMKLPFSYKSGYGIVVFSNKALEEAREFFKEVLPSEETFKHHDRVLVKKTGFISTIKEIWHEDKNITRRGIKKHIYKSEIVLADGGSYRATELQHCFITLLNKLAFPLPNAIFFGEAPQYAFDVAVATQNLVRVKMTAMEDRMSADLNVDMMKIPLIRETPFASCVERFLKNIDIEKKQAEEKATATYQATKKKKLEEARQIARKRFKCNG